MAQRRSTVADEQTDTPGGHVPVLADEVGELLAPAPGETYVDATAGLGGHAARIATAIGPAGVVVLNDLDAGNLDRAAAAVGALPRPPRVVEVHGNFAELPERLEQMGLAASMLLADLGFASVQVEDPARGFSFSRDGPLDMRLDRSSGVTAGSLLASLSERELADLIYQFGEERQSRRIARKVVEARRRGPISTTVELASIVRSAFAPGPRRGIDPATRTFQALRIAVNGELESLRSLLGAIERAASGSGPNWLARGARVAIVSFHSLEDREVKQSFRRLSDAGLAALLTRKPVVAGEAEVANNPRSRSAKLRALRLLS